jgi:hypothetical protein
MYTISRGHEPYEFDENCTVVLRKFQAMVFPELSEDSMDVVIGKPWNNSYGSS